MDKTFDFILELLERKNWSRTVISLYIPLNRVDEMLERKREMDQRGADQTAMMTEGPMNAVVFNPNTMNQIDQNLQERYDICCKQN